MNGKDFTNLRELLEREAARRNDPDELDISRPDPLMIAKQVVDERAILLCALFGYGKASSIVTFLSSLDFSLLDASDDMIEKGLRGKYYRFQTNRDVVTAFKALKRLGKGTLEPLFMQGYRRRGRVIDGVFMLIRAIDEVTCSNSRGLRFLFSSLPSDGVARSPYKRWMMFLRWMVRKDALDLGLWKGVSCADLIVPLDTHTFHVGQRLGLITRKSYDYKAALQLTDALRRFDPQDPVRYDFALYRIGQERIVT